MTRPSWYLHGDRVEYTGQTQVLHGATFYTVVYVEGHRIGQEAVTQRPPLLSPASV